AMVFTANAESKDTCDCEMNLTGDVDMFSFFEYAARSVVRHAQKVIEDCKDMEMCNRINILSGIKAAVFLEVDEILEDWSKNSTKEDIESVMDAAKDAIIRLVSDMVKEGEDSNGND
ncbi:MAG: hypothetical protein ACSW79_02040, partial [Eubacteriales bacterium]